LLSTTRQVGSAVNLAVLVAVATAWAAGHGGSGTATGLTAGFGVGFVVAAGMLAVACAASVLLPGRGRSISRADGAHPREALVPPPGRH
jgi:hypothetical protein